MRLKASILAFLGNYIRFRCISISSPEYVHLLCAIIFFGNWLFSVSMVILVDTFVWIAYFNCPKDIAYRLPFARLSNLVREEVSVLSYAVETYPCDGKIGCLSRCDIVHYVNLSLF